MKVAVIIDFWFPKLGGGQVNAWEISKRLANKSLNVDIITRDYGRDSLAKVPHLKIYKLGPKGNPKNIILELVFLINLFIFLAKSKYDLYHVHPFLPMPFVKIISLIKNVPVVATVHGTRIFEGRNLSPSISVERYILTKIRYDKVISVSRAFLKFRNINKNVSIIPNGINVKKLKREKVSKFSEPTILWVGRFDPVKRVEDLLLAYKDVKKRIKNAQLLLVGYGYQKKKYKHMVKDYNLRNVSFLQTANKSELISLYQKSHVFVLPSSSEGQPLTVLEAIASFLPVVATKVGGIPELIKDNENGLLVSPYNPNQLSKAIQKALEGKIRVTSKDISRLKKIHNWASIANLTKNIYKDVVKNK